MGRRLNGAQAGLSLALALTACEGESTLDRVASTGFFTPDVLEFGVVGVGETKQLETTFRNTSGTSMTVLNVGYEPDRSAYVVRDENMGTLRNRTLRSGSSEKLTVQCSPPTEGDYDTTMVLVLLDQEIALPIRASARVLAPATPHLEPASVTFQDVEVGRNVAQRVRIRNDGDLPGTLVVGARSTGAFQLTAVGGAPLPAVLPTLEPKEEFEVELHFTPNAVDRVEGLFEVAFGRQTARLQGIGSGQLAGVLTCDTRSIDFGAVPRGATLRRPVACSVTGGPYTLAALRFGPGTSPLFRVPTVPAGLDENREIHFEVELAAAGLPEDHTGLLEIIAAHGVVYAIDLRASVDPPVPGSTDLSVELSWNSTATDFDLHLVRAGTGGFFDDVDDCFFQNKNPDWGDVGQPGDDPFLDRDDTDGFGPEELNLTTAKEAYYDLYVQFFNYIGTTPPTTTAYVTINLRGSPPFTLQANIFRCGDTWNLGRFTFPSGGGTPSFTLADQLTDTWRGLANVKCR